MGLIQDLRYSLKPGNGQYRAKGHQVEDGCDDDADGKNALREQDITQSENHQHQPPDRSILVAVGKFEWFGPKDTVAFEQ